MQRIKISAGGEARTVVAAEDPVVVRRVVSGLEALATPYVVLEPTASVVSAAPGGAVYCLDARVAADLPGFRGPTIVILSGARLTDEAVLRLQGRRMCTLRLDGLTPASLLGAMVAARGASEEDSLAAKMARLGRLRRVPPGLITAFLHAPAEMLRLHHLRRALAPVSRESAQRMVRAAGFPRAEHLFTALRCAAWVLLKQEGVNRREIERYLGIGDRTSFRRACRRAGVPPVHEHLSPEAFDASPAPILIPDTTL